MNGIGTQLQHPTTVIAKNAPAVSRLRWQFEAAFIARLIVNLFGNGRNLFDPRVRPREHQREGIEKVNDLLYYDPEKPIGPANKPRVLILETCRNVVWALENLTGLDGPHGACKDFIDLLRYMALNPPVYFPPEALVCRGGWSVLGGKCSCTGVWISELADSSIASLPTSHMDLRGHLE